MTTLKIWVVLALLLPVVAAAPASAAVEPQTSNGTPYVSGGVSAEEQAEMRQMRAQYPLHLLFAVQGSGEYLADVGVAIVDQQGRKVLDAVAQGPFLYAKLPAGTYRLTATSDGHPIARSVTVPQTGSVEERFYWPPAR